MPDLKHASYETFGHAWAREVNKRGGYATTVYPPGTVCNRITDRQTSRCRRRNRRLDTMSLSKWTDGVFILMQCPEAKGNPTSVAARGQGRRGSLDAQTPIELLALKAVPNTNCLKRTSQSQRRRAHRVAIPPRPCLFQASPYTTIRSRFADKEN